MHFSTGLSKQRANKSPRAKFCWILLQKVPKHPVMEDTTSYRNLLLRSPAGSRTLLRVWSTRLTNEQQATEQSCFGFFFTPLLSPKRLQFTFTEQSFVAALRHYHVPATCYGAKKNWQIWIGASVITAQPSLLLAVRYVISSYSSPLLKHCSWFTFASTATCVVTLWPSFIRMLWVKKSEYG